MPRTTQRTQLVVGLALATLLVAVMLEVPAAPHAAVTGPPASYGERVAGVPRPTSPTDGAYQAALGVWDGATLVGDDENAARWLAVGLLISRGDYAAARRQLSQLRQAAPPDSPVSLKTELLLAGTSGGRKLIALAYDDFPFPTRSPQLLDVLAQARVPETFFAIGHKVRQYPDLVARAVTQGHSVQNHTYNHVRLAGLTAAQVQQELDACSQSIQAITGVAPRYLRAPHAASNVIVNREAARSGVICVDPIVTNVYDMSTSAETTYRRCLQRAKPGAILALHDGLPNTVEAMPRVIAALRAQGYEFVTVDELLTAAPPATTLLPVAAATDPLLSGWMPRCLAAALSDPDQAPTRQ